MPPTACSAPENNPPTTADLEARAGVERLPESGFIGGGQSLSTGRGQRGTAPPALAGLRQRTTRNASHPPTIAPGELAVAWLDTAGGGAKTLERCEVATGRDAATSAIASRAPRIEVVDPDISPPHRRQLENQRFIRPAPRKRARQRGSGTRSPRSVGGAERLLMQAAQACAGARLAHAARLRPIETRSTRLLARRGIRPWNRDRRTRRSRVEEPRGEDQSGAQWRKAQRFFAAHRSRSAHAAPRPAPFQAANRSIWLVRAREAVQGAVRASIHALVLGGTARARSMPRREARPASTPEPVALSASGPNACRKSIRTPLLDSAVRLRSARAFRRAPSVRDSASRQRERRAVQIVRVLEHRPRQAHAVCVLVRARPRRAHERAVGGTLRSCGLGHRDQKVLWRAPGCPRRRAREDAIAAPSSDSRAGTMNRRGLSTSRPPAARMSICRPVGTVIRRIWAPSRPSRRRWDESEAADAHTGCGTDDRMRCPTGCGRQYSCLRATCAKLPGRRRRDRGPRCSHPRGPLGHAPARRKERRLEPRSPPESA